MSVSCWLCLAGMLYFNHMKTITMYLAVLPVMAVLDLFWLGVVSKKVYAGYLGPLMRSDVVWPAAIVFYFAYAAGLVYFAVNPGIQANSWNLALLNGALYGLMCYMTYDLTNWAVLKGWPWQIVPIDIIWGTVLSAIVAVVAFFITKAFI